jgi:hypothetical protein
VSASFEITLVLPEWVHLRLLNPDLLNIAKIMRVDVNGTRTVRTRTGLLPSTSPAIDVDDFEYALSGQVVYTAYTTSGAVAATITLTSGQFPHVVVIAAPLYPSDGTVIADGSLDPTEITFAIAWDATRDAHTTVHDVIGRPGPVAVLRAAGLQAGTITFIGPDYLTTEHLSDQLSLPRVFMLRQADVPGLSLYFVVTSLGLVNIDPAPHWQLAVQFREVSWPSGDYQPTGVWTYADLAVAYPDYNAVAATFEDYLAVLERRPTP